MNCSGIYFQALYGWGSWIWSGDSGEFHSARGAMECKPIIKHQEGLMVGKYSAWGEGEGQ